MLGLTTTAVACAAAPGQCVSPPTVVELESGTFALPALASGQTYALAVTATVTAAPGSVANTATIAAPAGASDPDGSNNDASDSDTVTAAPVVADLAITKDDGVATVVSGAATTYTLTVTNNGPDSVTGALLADPAVLGLTTTAVACAAAPGQCVSPPTVVELESGTFALPALASGQTYALAVTATVTAAPGSVANTATIAAPAGASDPDGSNNDASDSDTVTAAPVVADLAITKDDGVATVVSGAATTYTLTVTNNGPDSVTGALLADPAVLGLTTTAVACAAAPGQCVSPPTVVELESGTFALPALASGQTYALAVTATVTAAPGSVANTATIAAPAGASDPDGSNNDASDSDTVTAAPVVADLAITKDDGVATVVSGAATTYTLTVTNNGPDSVTGALLADPAVLGLTTTAVACAAAPGQCVSPPTVVELESGTFALPALASGQTYALAVTATVTAAPGSVANTATIAAPAGASDPDGSNNDASDSDTVTAAPVVADLAITKDDGVATVVSGAATTYTLTVTNNGPDSVTGALLADPAVLGLTTTAVACAAAPGQCVSPPTVVELESGTFALPALASGQTYALAVTATVTAAPGSVANTATIAAPAGASDPDGSNNDASDSDTVTAAPVVADLAITKDDGVATVVSGAATTYTLTVTNNGPDSVTGALLADPAVLGLTTTAVACAAAPGQCVSPPTVVELESGTFALPALASGQTYALAVTATVTAAPGTVANTATIAAPAGASDPDGSNNDASDSDTVTAAPVVADLAITKDDGVATVVSGAATTYTLTVTNNGPDSVTGALLADPAVLGLTTTAVACAAAPGQCVSPPTVVELESGTFALPALASGQTYALAVTATVTAAPGSVANTATIAAPAGASDPDGSNNDASDSDTVTAAPVVADLAITKTDGVATVVSGRRDDLHPDRHEQRPEPGHRGAPGRPGRARPDQDRRGLRRGARPVRHPAHGGRARERHVRPARPGQRPDLRAWS